jgi:hypothetical protein
MFTNTSKVAKPQKVRDHRKNSNYVILFQKMCHIYKKRKACLRPLT